MSSPRVHRCTIARSSGWLAPGSKRRTNAAARPQNLEERADRVQHAGDAAEGERCRAEAGDLPVARVGERPDQVYRIAGGFLAVVVAIEAVEGGAKRRLKAHGSRLKKDLRVFIPGFCLSLEP